MATGGFEPRVVDDGTFVYTTLPNWSSSTGKIEVWGSGKDGVPAYEGRQLVELNASDATEISQTVDVTGGIVYRWSLVHRGRRDDDTMEVRIDGQLVARITSSPGAWRTVSGEIEVPVGQDRVVLALRAVDDGARGNLIDDVRFEAVRVIS